MRVFGAVYAAPKRRSLDRRYDRKRSQLLEEGA
jgi:hypothetical protein